MWNQLTEGWPAVAFVAAILIVFTLPISVALFKCHRNSRKRYVVVRPDGSRTEAMRIEVAMAMARMVYGSTIEPAKRSEIKAGEETSLDEDCKL